MLEVMATFHGLRWCQCRLLSEISCIIGRFFMCVSLSLSPSHRSYQHLSQRHGRGTHNSNLFHQNPDCHLPQELWTPRRWRWRRRDNSRAAQWEEGHPGHQTEHHHHRETCHWYWEWERVEGDNSDKNSRTSDGCEGRASETHSSETGLSQDKDSGGTREEQNSQQSSLPHCWWTQDPQSSHLWWERTADGFQLSTGEIPTCLCATLTCQECSFIWIFNYSLPWLPFLKPLQLLPCV